MKLSLKATSLAVASLSVLLLFQNCAPSGGSESSQSSLEAAQPDPQPVEPKVQGKRSDYQWICSFTLKRPNANFSWSVERYSKDNSCSSEEGIVRTNNPQADIIAKSINSQVVESDVVNAARPAYRCEFTLRGANGTVWRADRYSDESTCTRATASVRSNNPNATIQTSVAIYQGYDLDVEGELPATKCLFKLRGYTGHEWSVERFTDATDCSVPRAAVQSNNPRASILSEQSIFQGFEI